MTGKAGGVVMVMAMALLVFTAVILALTVLRPQHPVPAWAQHACQRHGGVSTLGPLPHTATCNDGTGVF